MSGFKCFCQHCACLHSEHTQQTGGKPALRNTTSLPVCGCGVQQKSQSGETACVSDPQTTLLLRAIFKTDWWKARRWLFLQHTLLYFLFWQWPKHIFQHYPLSYRISWLLLLLQSSSYDSSRKAEIKKKKKNSWHLRYLDWNTSNCYFSQEKCLARILFAASIAFQKMQSNQIQHICKCGTAFNVSNELCTGCGSKIELGVIICSVSKKSIPNQELYFLFQRASYSTVTAAYLSSSLFTAPASLDVWMVFFSFLAYVILGFAISSWKKAQEYQNPTLSSLAMNKMKSECSVKILKKNIFATFYSPLYRPHQINSVFFSTQSAKGWLWCRKKHLLGSALFSLPFLESICKKHHDRNNSALNFFCILHSQMSSPRGIWY